MRVFSRLLTAFLLLCPFCACSYASTITFDRQNGTSFLYDLTVNDNLILTSGQSINFSGLIGVFGAAIFDPVTFDTAFTATTVTYTVRAGRGFNFFNQTSKDLFTIQSTASLGTGALYATPVTAQGSLSGTTSGPTAVLSPTPEPSSFFLLATGLLGTLGAIRQRLSTTDQADR